MPFGIGGKSPLKFSKKKTYTVQEHHHQASPHHHGGGGGGGGGGGSSSSSVAGKGRRNTAPAGILKRGGSRPVSYPALEDGMVPQEMAAASPMPTEAELNQLFVEMVVSVCVCVCGCVCAVPMVIGSGVCVYCKHSLVC